MSLINQVIADLGQRKSGQPLPANGVLIGTVLAASLPTPRYTQYLPFGAVVIAVIACVVLLWPSSGYDYTAALTNVIETSQDDIPLKLTAQLNHSNEGKREEKSVVVMLDRSVEHPVAHAKKDIDAAFFSNQLDDVLVKDVTGIVPGHKKQVRLLLSGNVSSTINNSSLQNKEKAQKSYTISQLGYMPVLALDSNIRLDVKRLSSSNNIAAEKTQASIEEHRIISRNMQMPIELQPQQKNSIRKVTNVQRAEQVYQHALTLNAKGDLQQAIAKLKKVLSLNSSHLKARYTVAALLINTNQSDAALQELRAGMNIQSDYAPFAKLYGRLMMQRGELDDAIAVMEKARGDAQNDAEYYSQLAAIYQQNGMHPEAISYYKQALRWRSTVGVWWMGLGISLEQQKYTRDAVTAYQKANATGTLSDDVLSYVQSRIKSLEMWK